MSASSAKLVRLLVSPDKSVVEAELRLSEQGVPPTLDDCLGVIYGAELRVDETLTDRLTTAIEQLEGDPNNSLRVVIREGTPPEHGVDGSVEWFVDDDDDVCEETPVDHYNRSAFVMVASGDEIGRVNAPTPGDDGVDAWGQVIPARPGREVSIKHDESILTGVSGVMIAQVDGVLSRSLDKACIRQYLEIDGNVDFSTGNIEFDGDVSIRGGVRDNFVLKATGNTEVGGLVEAARVESGGGITLAGGAAGREEGVIKAGGELTVKYLDSCEVDVGGDLVIEREMVDCTVRVMGAVRSPRAVVMGGEVTVIGAVELGVVGSNGGTETTLRLGRVPTLESKLNKLNELRESLVARVESMEGELGRLAMLGGRATPNEAERQTELSFELVTVRDQLASCEASADELITKIESLSTVHVTIGQKLHEGVVLEFAQGSYRVNRTLSGPVTILRQRDGQIVYRVGDQGANVPIKTISAYSIAA